MPNHMKPLDGIIEVIFDELYDELQGYKCVLDLGGYIGESAVKLAQFNDNVVVYEAHPDNFVYLMHNIQKYKNIIGHNYAVIGDYKENTTLYGGAFYMSANNQRKLRNAVSIQTPSINIIDVLSTYDFDAIKMDIEGSEYECMDAIIQYGSGFFKKLQKGFIEFHFLQDKQNIEHIKKIIQRITEQGYTIKCIDMIKNKYIFGEISDTEHTVVLLIFTKI